jgi:non-specific serine/threonine protein kinase/serine/threonine-protein kinase
MPADTPRRAHALFTEALGLDAPARAGLLDERCADDPDLRARVERLLAAASRSTGFLETPALRADAAGLAPLPDAVGTYLVVGVLGVGGMATVYEAVQENPSRRVALKVMHHALAHTDAYLRFRLETETLARLHHPGIAQIYEAGTARLGQPAPSPFFAMELVPDAVTITDYAARHELPLRRRLAMFAEVCDAVLHGHQHGVIHRDIKPGNVLVGPDGKAKVIDFGIARPADAGAPSVTRDADTRRLIGTLAAMSPEQCESPRDVDVRTDVYSLGVMLYELVTGRRPYDLSACSIPEAVRIICERDPERPSSHAPEARGDLDAVIAKAMHKDRDRRYPGAGALAADVRRFLGHVPVEARNATSFEHAMKFARRNPPLAGALAAAVLSLVAGVAVSVTLAGAARRARDEALARERDLAVVTSFQESLLRGIDVSAMGDTLRDALLASASAAHPDARADLERLTAPVNFTALAVRSLDDHVLQRALRDIQGRFADQPRLRARLLQQLAETMNSLGLHARAEPVLRDALQVRRDTLGDAHEDTVLSEFSLGSLLSTLGKLDESLALLTDAHARRLAAYGPEAPPTLRAASSLAGVHRRRGELDDAQRIWTETLEVQRRTLGSENADTLRTINNLGVAYAAQGRLDRAEPFFRELVETRRRLFGQDSPEYRSSLGNLGVVLQDQGRFDEARPLIEQSLEADRKRYGDTHSDTLITMGQLASLLQETGDLAGAEKLQRECAAARLAALGPDHADTMRADVTLASILHERGSRDEANALMTDVLARQRRLLGDSHPDTILAIDSASAMAAREGRVADAVNLGEEAYHLARASLHDDPTILGRITSRYAGVLARTSRPADALPLLLEGHGTLQKALGDTHPLTREAAGRLADYFDAADAREPGAGHAANAAAWRQRSKPPFDAK